MTYALAPVAALLIGVAVLMTGNGLQHTLLPVRAALDGFSTFSIAVIGAAYFVGFTLGCLKGGVLVKRVGHVRVFLAMTALASASPLLHGMIPHPGVWIVLRFITGFCIAVSFVVVESWLNESSTNESRGLVFSTYVMITLVLLVAGQMMTLLYAPEGLELFLIASVLVSLSAVPVALSQSKSPEQPTEVELDIKRLFRLSPAGTLGCLAAGATMGAFWSLAPLFVAAYQDEIALAAWFMSAVVLGGALGQWPLGTLSDRFGRRKVMLASSLLAAVLATAIVLLAETLGLVGISLLGAAWGAIAWPLYSISVAHANDYADASDYVMISAGLLLMYGVGAVAGPFAASGLIALIGAQGLFVMSIIVNLLLAVYMLSRVLRRKRLPDDRHVPFGDALASAYSASQVYEEELLHKAADDDAG